MPRHPLAEVFGFPTDNFSSEAGHYRRNRLCPFNNKVPNCTKDKANAPLGVCSVYYEEEKVVVTCPIRFRERWTIASDAAVFFFGPKTQWTSLTEIRLPNRHGESAGSIDVVLVAYDANGRITDFGALEVQAVYISGNIRKPFEYYLEDAQNRADMDWHGQRYYPRPDFLSSTRKRLAPQLIYKGGILHSWGKKMAVAVDWHLFATLPHLPEVEPSEAEIAWLVYDLALDAEAGRYHLVSQQSVYTLFDPALQTITTAEAGPVEEFVGSLQEKLDARLETGYAPDAPSLLDVLE